MRMPVALIVRVSAAAVAAGLTAGLAAGCDVRIVPPVVAVHAETPAVEVDAPLVTGPGVTVVTDEPPIDARVYVYDPGFPPGVYLWGGFYYYGGHRYAHDVFLNRVVNVNLRNHRFTNVEENRRAGRAIETRHRADYARTGGHHPAPARRPEERNEHEH